MMRYKIAGIFLTLVLIAGLTGVAFAQYGDDSSNTRESAHDNNGKSKNSSTDDSQNYTKSDDQNKTGEESQSEYRSLNENNQTGHEEDHQTNQEENKTSHEGEDHDQKEIDNENNNEKATHHEDQQSRNDVSDAIENKTVSTIVNIGEHNQETKSIDDNIDAHTDNSTNDSVSVTVDSKTESGPKVIIFNLNSTTIDVSSVKYLHITYDGHSISPAADINSVLHAKSTDNPSYAIIITQNGAQVLVSIPHFSNHTITLSSISQVMSSVPPVPEFPLAVPVLLAGTVSVIAFYRMKFTK